MERQTIQMAHWIPRRAQTENSARNAPAPTGKHSQKGYSRHALQEQSSA